MLALAVALVSATPVVDHQLTVRLDVAKHALTARDEMKLDKERATVELLLHAGLQPKVVGATSQTITKGEGLTEIVRATLEKPARTIVVEYAGVIEHPPQQVATEHQRSFQETPGTIDARGVYLSASSYWFPRVAGLNEMFTATIRVDGMPSGWDALSEGDRGKDGAWISQTPSDELHLVAGPFVKRSQRKEGVDVMVWLRTDDPALAEKYIEVTGQYLKMYNDLIGQYPYGKFALVENFWETGYGMPSFTLLGPQVIRFPFILHSSYPHELLHNWWGNGVFVDGGNWSEGLTSYLADHTNSEMQGKGDEYRRTTLTKYADFVSTAKDFPLATFAGRFSSASEAIGYGKWMMVVHMLRQKLGDTAFKEGLRAFWKKHRFDRATFDDIRAAFQAQTKDDLAPFFEAWVGRAGAPRVRWTAVSQERTRDGKHTLTITLAQTQGDAAFPVDIPVVVTTADGRGVKATVAMTAKTATEKITLPSAAARVDIDPFADAFRQILPGETAPALSRSLGAQKATFVLPTLATADERAQWTKFMNGICGSEIECKSVDDSAIEEIPGDRAVWILGYGNRLRAAAIAGSKKFGARFDDRGFLSPGPWNVERLKTERTDPAKSSLAIALAHPKNDQKGMVFVGAHTAKAIELLARKIPHYGKYGYISFEGDAVENKLKGQWEPEASPLTIFMGNARPKIALKSGPALMKLPPPFDGARMMDLVKRLADPALEGRATPKTFAQAADIVAKELKDAGLDVKIEKWGVDATLPGKDASLSPVVLGAHLDGLAKKGRRVHPGADDNASGVAVLVEVARALKKTGPYQRPVRFIAFDGEEQGLKGSRAFVATLPKGAVHSMVNLDTVGRKGDRKLLILNGDSASEWAHVFRGVGFTTGVQTELAKEGGSSSDQVAFIEAGIPAVQIFSGPHVDYHRPTDTADKVEPNSLVDAAVVARETIAYLADRKEPLSFGGASSGAGGGGERRASLGTVPDMTFTGPGVRVDDVVPGSPAQKLALQKGDVLIKLDANPIADLKAYSDLLKTKKPGDTVKIVVMRAGKEIALDATLSER